jgi:hypothetical protein
MYTGCKRVDHQSNINLLKYKSLLKPKDRAIYKGPQTDGNSVLKTSESQE